MNDPRPIDAPPLDPVALLDPVGNVIRSVSAEIIDPRFRALDRSEIIEKGPGDLVTVADREAEAALSERFAELLPGVPVVGEEAVAADDHVLRHLDGDGPVWIIDPIDGTKNFVDGSPDHAVMVALVDRREAVASWIWYPQRQVMLDAARGHGVRRNGVRVVAQERATAVAELRGIVKFWKAPRPLGLLLKDRRLGMAHASGGRGCAGVEYGSIVLGEYDALFYWMAHAWDHVPGSLLVTELGGVAAHIDGTPYRASSTGEGLLVAASEPAWQATAALLFKANPSYADRIQADRNYGAGGSQGMQAES